MNANPTALRLFSVLASVLSCFCIYYFILTPNLEPPLPETLKIHPEHETVVLESPYSRFFPENAWERKAANENQIKMENMVLLFQSFTKDQGNKLKSKKCTILIAPGHKTFPIDKSNSTFHPAIISILEGVEIQLDDEKTGDGVFPSLVGGKLFGPINISYQTKVKDMYLKSFLSTSDLFCDMNSVRTVRPVHFEFGTLVGDGEQMHIQFKSKLETGAAFSGIESVQITHLDRIVMEISKLLLEQLNLKLSPEMEKKIEKIFEKEPSFPIELKCDGPMLYKVSDGTVTFQKNVSIVCKYPTLPPDTLHCGELVLHLTPDVKNRFLVPPNEPHGHPIKTETQPEIETGLNQQNAAVFYAAKPILKSAETANTETANTETANTETANTETANIETANTEAANAKTPSGMARTENVHSQTGTAPTGIQLKQADISKMKPAEPSDRTGRASASSKARRLGAPEMEKESNKSNSTLDSLPLDSISAKQNVRLNLPSLNCSAETEVLEFHLGNQMVQLSSSQQSRIQFGQHEFHANNITYYHPQNSSQTPIGKINVSGNGWYRTNLPSSTPQQENFLRMNWRQKLTSENLPDGNCQIEVLGNVEIESNEFGKITADRIECILRKKTDADTNSEARLLNQLQISSSPQSSEEKKYLPQNLTAEGNIRLNLRQEKLNLHANLDRVSINFQQAQVLPEYLRLGLQNASGSPIPSGNQTPFSVSNVQQSAKTSSDSSEQRNFILQAGELTGEIQLLPGNEKFFVSKLQLKGQGNQNLALREDLPFVNSEQQINLTARQVTLLEVNPATLQGEIEGSPAVLAGHGVKLETSRIALNCAANRIDINDAGQMHIFVRRENQLNFSTLSETLISWKKNMFFDGKLISMEDDVKIQESLTNLRAEKVKAQLTKRINLTKPPKIAKDQQIQSFFSVISAEQNVSLHHEKLDRNKQITDVFKLKTNSINFQPRTMLLHIMGRGSLRISHLGNFKKRPGGPQNSQSERGGNVSENFDLNSAHGYGTQGIGRNAGESKPEWNQIYLEYFGGISGNLNTGEFTIQKDISALMQPVPNEKYEIPQARVPQREVHPKGFQFSCDTIYINQVPTNSNLPFMEQNFREMKLEFQADGNVHLENITYSVDGNTLKYSQEKNTCLVLGKPNLPVQISYQEFLGGPWTGMQAGNVEINLETQKFKLDAVRIDATLGR